MQCYNCGYINFQRVKKCPSCSTPLEGTQSHVELAEDPTFTVFAGELPDFGSSNDAEAALDAEFGVVEPVSGDADFSLDLSDTEGADTGLAEDETADFALDTDFAEGSDAAYGESQESSISSGLGTDVGPNDFELDLSEAIAEQIMASSMPTPTDSLDIEGEIAEDELDLDLDLDSDLDLDIDLEPALGEEAEITLDIDDVGVDLDKVEETDSADTFEVAEDDLDLEIGTEDDEPQLILDDEEPALELSEEPKVSLDLDTGGDDEIAFSLDDAAESVETTEPAEEKADDDEGGIEFGGLEMEETPDKDK